MKSTGSVGIPGKKTKAESPSSSLGKSVAGELPAMSFLFFSENTGASTFARPVNGTVTESGLASPTTLSTNGFEFCKLRLPRLSGASTLMVKLSSSVEISLGFAASFPVDGGAAAVMTGRMEAKVIMATALRTCMLKTNEVEDEVGIKKTLPIAAGKRMVHSVR